MEKIFITSDLHFGHQKEFLWGPRGFNSSEEHDEIIIQNWNSIVSPEDTVWVLGDLMLGDTQQGIKKLNQLNGHINIIIGNHDTTNRIQQYVNIKPTILVYGLAYILKYKKYRFYLSHYPTLTSNYDINKPLKQRVINLCGHSHISDKFGDMDKGLIYHCELDAHNNYPVLLDYIIDDLKNF